VPQAALAHRFPYFACAVQTQIRQLPISPLYWNVAFCSLASLALRTMTYAHGVPDQVPSRKMATRLACCDFRTGRTIAQRPNMKAGSCARLKKWQALTAPISAQSEPQQPVSRAPAQQATISPTTHRHASFDARYQTRFLVSGGADTVVLRPRRCHLFLSRRDRALRPETD
jgi:hypothetical protein